MKRFFVRIFAAVWIVMILTLALTLFVASWLPSGVADGADTAAVAAAAREMGELLAAQPDADLDAVVARHESGAGGDLRLLLIDSDGADALGRDLPLAVSRWLRRNNPALMDDLNWTAGDRRLIVHDEPLGDYRLVAYRGGMRPVMQALDRPGGRLILMCSALLTSLGASFVLARLIVLPLHRLERATRSAADGDLEASVASAVGGSGATARIARNVDRIAERAD